MKTAEFKQTMVSRYKTLFNSIMSFLEKDFAKRIKKIYDKLIAIRDELEKSYTTSEELLNLLEFLQTLNEGPESIKVYRDRIKLLEEYSNFFTTHSFDLREDTITSYFELQFFISILDGIAIERGEFLKEKKQSKLIANHLAKEKTDIKSTIHRIKSNFDDIKTVKLKDDPRDEFSQVIGKTYEIAENTKRSMMNTMKQIQGLNQREKVMNFNYSEFESVEEIENKFSPYYALWTVAKEFNNQIPLLLEVPFSSIENEDVEENVRGWLLELRAMLRKEGDYDKSSVDMMNFLIKKLEDTREFFPLIKFLKNHSLRPRHYDELSQRFCTEFPGLKLTPQKDFTLGILINT